MHGRVHGEVHGGVHGGVHGELHGGVHGGVQGGVHGGVYAGMHGEVHGWCTQPVLLHTLQTASWPYPCHIQLAGPRIRFRLHDQQCVAKIVAHLSAAIGPAVVEGAQLQQLQAVPKREVWRLQLA